MPFKIVRNDITRCERYDAITCGVYGCMMHTAFVIKVIVRKYLII